MYVCMWGDYLLRSSQFHRRPILFTRSIPMPNTPWTETQFRRYIQGCLTVDIPYLHTVLHPDLIVHYPGLPDFRSREAWISCLRDLHRCGWHDYRLKSFFSSHEGHATLYTMIGTSTINAAKLMTFLNVNVGDRIVLECGSFVYPRKDLANLVSTG